MNTCIRKCIYLSLLWLFEAKLNFGTIHGNRNARQRAKITSLRHTFFAHKDIETFQRLSSTWIKEIFSMFHKLIANNIAFSACKAGNWCVNEIKRVYYLLS